MGTLVTGFVADGFERVRDAFAGNIDERGDVGASFALWHRGRPVVDIAGGARSPGGEPYDDQTLQLVFSTTKGATAICLGMCVERGLLDLQAPVATYWPEFAAAGKEAITVETLMSHRAGLPTVDGKPSLADTARLDHHHRAVGRPGAVLGAGHGPRLPRPHLRLAGR